MSARTLTKRLHNESTSRFGLASCRGSRQPGRHEIPFSKNSMNTVLGGLQPCRISRNGTFTSSRVYDKSTAQTWHPGLRVAAGYVYAVLKALVIVIASRAARLQGCSERGEWVHQTWVVGHVPIMLTNLQWEADPKAELQAAPNFKCCSSMSCRVANFHSHCASTKGRRNRQEQLVDPLWPNYGFIPNQTKPPTFSCFLGSYVGWSLWYGLNRLCLKGAA